MATIVTIKVVIIVNGNGNDSGNNSGDDSGNNSHINCECQR